MFIFWILEIAKEVKLILHEELNVLLLDLCFIIVRKVTQYFIQQ